MLPPAPPPLTPGVDLSNLIGGAAPPLPAAGSNSLIALAELHQRLSPPLRRALARVRAALRDCAAASADLQAVMVDRAGWIVRNDGRNPVQLLSRLHFALGQVEQARTALRDELAALGVAVPR